MLKKNLFIVILAVLVFAGSAAAQTFDLEGFFMPEGKWLKDFRNIDHLYLNGKQANKIGGWIQLKNQARFKILTSALKGKEFDFQTAKSGGVSYEFSGLFILFENFSVTQPQGKVLKGTLKKFRNGNKISESPVSFTYFVGD